MEPVAVLAKIRISIPAEAVVPLAIGMAVLLVLVTSGAALASWKQKSPAKARMAGTICAVLLSGFAIYLAARLMPNKYIDLGPPDQPPISLADGPILGFTTIMATLMWRFADQRKVALGFGGVIGVALMLKPFVMPFVTWFSSGSERARVISDPDTLSILGPGVACVIAALIAGLKK